MKSNEEKVKTDMKEEDRTEEVETEKEQTENNQPLEEDNLAKDFLDLKEKVDELEKQKKELNEALLRRVAEFENYKKRTENEQLNLIKYAAEGFILNILPIYDDLERSLAHLKKENSASLKEGLKLVYNKFKKTLEEQGVQKIETKGTAFDFNLHEALMQREDSQVPSHTVLEEVEAGYLYKDKVIKHAKVIVSQQPENKSEGDGN